MNTKLPNDCLEKLLLKGGFHNTTTNNESKSVEDDDICQKEFDDAAHPDIILKTNAKKCKVCKVGDVIPDPKGTKDSGKFVIYTRNGTYAASHQTYRCNNYSLPCRSGHFYGYVSVGEKNLQSKCYEKLALKNEYLVTSSQTAFSVEYLYDCVLQILHSNASFESLSKIYSDFHFKNVPTDVMPRRVEAHRKRLSDAIMTYLFLEIGQRYGIPPIIRGGIDQTILETKSLFKNKFEEMWSVNHKCDVKGCSQCITIDGGMKPNRFICADKLSGITAFD